MESFLALKIAKIGMLLSSRAPEGYCFRVLTVNKSITLVIYISSTIRKMLFNESKYCSTKGRNLCQLFITDRVAEKVMFSQSCVILFTGGCASQQAIGRGIA